MFVLQALTNFCFLSKNAHPPVICQASSLIFISFVCVLVTQSCPPLCDPMDSSPPGSSVLRILQARILEWVAIPFFRESNPALLHCRQIFYHLSHQGSPFISFSSSNVTHDKRYLCLKPYSPSLFSSFFSTLITI